MATFNKHIKKFSRSLKFMSTVDKKHILIKIFTIMNELTDKLENAIIDAFNISRNIDDIYDNDTINQLILQNKSVQLIMASKNTDQIEMLTHLINYVRDRILLLSNKI